MSLDELPIVGQLAALAGVVVDLFATGGDVVFGIVAFLLAHVGLLFPLLTTLDKLANRIDWIPPELLSSAVDVVLVAMLALYAFRLVDNYQESKT